MPEVNKVLNDLKGKLGQLPEVLAFVLVGSQARESIYLASDYSDLEAYIIVKNNGVDNIKGHLPNLTSSLGKVLFSFNHQVGFVTVYDNLFRLELPVVKLSELPSIFNRPKAQTVKTLFDKTEGVLQKALDKRKDKIDYAKLFQNLYTNFWYWQIIGVQYFKKGEIYNTRAILNIHASALIKLAELLNNPEILLLESNKRVEHFLTEEQLNQLKNITPRYHKNEIKKALKATMDIFPLMFKQVNNMYGYKYDESIEEKVKPKLLELLD